jgi:hypothetical protein
LMPRTPFWEATKPEVDGQLASPGFKRAKDAPPRFTARQSFFYSSARGKSSAIPHAPSLPYLRLLASIPIRRCDIRRLKPDGTGVTFAIASQIWYRKITPAHFHRSPPLCLAAACFVEIPAFSLSSCAAASICAGDDGKWTPTAVVAANERFYQLQLPG